MVTVEPDAASLRCLSVMFGAHQGVGNTSEQGVADEAVQHAARIWQILHIEAPKQYGSIYALWEVLPLVYGALEHLKTEEGDAADLLLGVHTQESDSRRKMVTCGARDLVGTWVPTDSVCVARGHSVVNLLHIVAQRIDSSRISVSLVSVFLNLVHVIVGLVNHAVSSGLSDDHEAEDANESSKRRYASKRKHKKKSRKDVQGNGGATRDFEGTERLLREALGVLRLCIRAVPPAALVRVGSSISDCIKRVVGVCSMQSVLVRISIGVLADVLHYGICGMHTVCGGDPAPLSRADVREFLTTDTMKKSFMLLIEYATVDRREKVRVAAREAVVTVVSAFDANSAATRQRATSVPRLGRRRWNGGKRSHGHDSVLVDSSDDDMDGVGEKVSMLSGEDDEGDCEEDDDEATEYGDDNDEDGYDMRLRIRGGVPCVDGNERDGREGLGFRPIAIFSCIGKALVRRLEEVLGRIADTLSADCSVDSNGGRVRGLDVGEGAMGDNAVALELENYFLLLAQVFQYIPLAHVSRLVIESVDLCFLPRCSDAIVVVVCAFLDIASRSLVSLCASPLEDRMNLVVQKRSSDVRLDVLVERKSQTCALLGRLVGVVSEMCSRVTQDDAVVACLSSMFTAYDQLAYLGDLAVRCESMCASDDDGGENGDAPLDAVYGDFCSMLFPSFVIVTNRLRDVLQNTSPHVVEHASGILESTVLATFGGLCAVRSLLQQAVEFVAPASIEDEGRSDPLIDQIVDLCIDASSGKWPQFGLDKWTHLVQSECPLQGEFASRGVDVPIGVRHVAHGLLHVLYCAAALMRLRYAHARCAACDFCRCVFESIGLYCAPLYSYVIVLMGRSWMSSNATISSNDERDGASADVSPGSSSAKRLMLHRMNAAFGSPGGPSADGYRNALHRCLVAACRAVGPWVFFRLLRLNVADDFEQCVLDGGLYHFSADILQTCDTHGSLDESAVISARVMQFVEEAESEQLICRPWLVSVMKEACGEVSNDHLSGLFPVRSTARFCVDFIIPLAGRLGKRVAALRDAGRPTLARSMRVIEMDLWSAIGPVMSIACDILDPWRDLTQPVGDEEAEDMADEETSSTVLRQFPYFGAHCC